MSNQDIAEERNLMPDYDAGVYVDDHGNEYRNENGEVLTIEENKVEIGIPFDGFYNSVSDMRATEAVENHFMDDMGEVPEEYQEAIYMADIDWQAIHRDYAKLYAEYFTEMVKEEIGLDLTPEFSDLESPREYNFSTDKIFINITEKQARELREKAKNSHLYEQYIKDVLAPRSGFIPFFSNDVNHDDWKGELEAVQYKILLDLLLQDHFGEYSDWDIYLMDDAIGNGEVMGLDSVQDAVEKVEKEVKKQKTA